jgi:hypothetical protein
MLSIYLLLHNLLFCEWFRSAMAVVVCKFIFQAFDNVEEDEQEGKIFEKESRAAQAAGAVEEKSESQA